MDRLEEVQTSENRRTTGKGPFMLVNNASEPGKKSMVKRYLGCVLTFVFKNDGNGDIIGCSAARFGNICPVAKEGEKKPRMRYNLMDSIAAIGENAIDQDEAAEIGAFGASTCDWKAYYSSDYMRCVS